MSMPREPARPAGGSRSGCRGDAVVHWLGWHLAELLGVGVPLVLAVTVSVWWLVLAATAGAAWGAHELRVARRRRQALQVASPRSAVASRPMTTDTDETSAPAGDYPAPSTGRTGKGVSA